MANKATVTALLKIKKAVETADIENLAYDLLFDLDSEVEATNEAREDAVSFIEEIASRVQDLVDDIDMQIEEEQAQ